MLITDNFQFAAAEIQAIAGTHLDENDRADLHALAAILERRGTAVAAAGRHEDEGMQAALVDLVCAIEVLYGFRPPAPVHIQTDEAVE